jgi:hypothetical protein
MGVILVCNPRTFEPAPESLAWLFIYKSQYGKIGKEEETFCSTQQSWILKRK